MPCDEWCQLIERYRSAVHTYDEAAKALSDLPGTAFNEIWHRTERARQKCDRRRADLLQHEHKHGCLQVSQPVKNNRLSGLKTEALVLGDQGQSGG